MAKNCKAAGTRREHQVMRFLQGHRYETMRAPASIGAADIVALKPGCQPLYVQVKANKDGGPYKSFGPRDRRELREAALRAGAAPVLVWWPPHGEMQWIDEAFWPKEKTSVEVDAGS